MINQGDRGPIVRRLRRQLQPVQRRTVVAQLVGLALVLTGLSAVAVVVLLKLAQWLGPWWQPSR